MAKYTDLDEALANPQDVEDGRIHHTGATTPRKAGISCLVGIRLPTGSKGEPLLYETLFQQFEADLLNQPQTGELLILTPAIITSSSIKD